VVEAIETAFEAQKQINFLPFLWRLFKRSEHIKWTFCHYVRPIKNVPHCRQFKSGQWCQCRRDVATPSGANI